MKKFKKIFSGVLLVFFLISLLYSYTHAKENTKNITGSLNSIVNKIDGISIVAKPVNLSSSEIVFEIAINTHSGSLDFDMSQISELVINNEKVMKPIKWKGSAPGGHHRYGKILFAGYEKEINKMELIIKDNDNKRIYEWTL
ncbi:MAG: hypothetical protein FXF49_10455 [Flexistipes sinusarabici]|uniref:Uncharacterized protein n=1 Tax=Flexistipes sinusarabici TaxID=2352 RepID=A0A5D0MME9_FLESI|nr:hypothetical protein [Flexistipes sinusarabici]TYB32641.1 MAG: hypothetical protein FXF49_10455 [Flexistipes sinusarabici]